MPQDPTFVDDEVDLREIIAALWSHKILITLFTGLSIFLAGNHALSTQKKYTATAIFQIQQDDGPGINIPGELGALASLAGLSTDGASANSEIFLERAIGREFILRMANNFDLERDPYFNTYDPEYKDPVWKATIKQIIGWQKTEIEKKAIIEKNIIERYRKNVVFEKTDGGVLSITVTHINPQKASYYANNFMEDSRRLVENESAATQELRLSYLSETLADALQEIEIAQDNLRDYTLKNSAMAQENFISDSLKLDQIRMEKRKVVEIADLLSIIESLIKSGNLDNNSYEALRISHPLVDDIDFRRILGMSETISAWVWPEIEAIVAVSTTLRDRLKRLDIDINNIEDNAKMYATSAENLVKFKREAKIAEATYKVLVEQVKSQSLAAGFQPETFKVFEYATPPLSPSSPKRNLILILGAFLGILIGCGISLINAFRRGVYYTSAALVGDVTSDLTLRSKSIKRLSRKPFPQIISFISKKRLIVLDEACIKLSDKKIIYVVSPGGRISSSNAAQLLAVKSARSGRNIVLCDTTGQLEKKTQDMSTKNSEDPLITNIAENISVLNQVDESSFFTSKSFNSKIKDLTDRFDQVFLCSSNRNAYVGLIALSELDTGLVVISSLRKTKKLDIKNVKSRQPVDILFHD